MNIEDILADQFAREADRRPDAASVLDAVHLRTARRDQITRIRALSALAAAAAVAAIVIAATVIAAPSDPHSQPAAEATTTLTPTTAPTPPTPTPALTTTPTPLNVAPALRTARSSASPATPTPDPTPPAPTPAPTTAPTPPKVASALRTDGSSAPAATTATTPEVSGPAEAVSYWTIDAGWLPGPAKLNVAGLSSRPGVQERDWDVTVDGAAMDVIIWTETGSLPTQMQATGGGQADFRAITINGHPGREFIADHVTIIAFDLGNGTIAYVGPSAAELTAAVTTERITAVAVKVATNMQFDRHDPIPGS